MEGQDSLDVDTASTPPQFEPIGPAVGAHASSELQSLGVIFSRDVHRNGIATAILEAASIEPAI